MKKGDIFVTSWGYDQTQHDFIIVLSVSPSGKTVLCDLCRTTSENGYEDIHPVKKGCGGKPFRMKIEGEYLRGSYPFCGINHDSKRLDTFSRYNPDIEYNDTHPMMGH